MSEHLKKNSSGGLIIESSRLEDYIEFINENDIKSLYINSMDFKLNNIGFLKKCPALEEIAIDSKFITDYTGLYEVKKLDSLTIFDPVGIVDLSLVNKLKYLHLSLNKKIINLKEQISLEFFCIRDYKPESKNLEELPVLGNLTEFELIKSNITSINGIERFKNLEKIEFHYLSKLEDIKKLCTFSNKLRELRMENCKKVIFEDYLSCLKELETLAIVNCGNFPSIQYIKDMRKLKDFIFPGMDVLDGDISPCFGLEYVHFTNKKHFNHKENEFNNTF